MIEFKKCKGQNKANNFDGCGKEVFVKDRKYGLCQDCYRKWIISDDPKAKQHFDSFLTNHKKQYERQQKRKEKAIKDDLNISKVMRLADMYFSRYVRLIHSKNGLCTCYTCGIIQDIKEVDNGHYIKREHKSTRFNLDNCRPQCKTCNGDTKHNGKQTEFRENLVNEFDEKFVLELEALGRKPIKANGLFYRNLADEYRTKLNELQRELKVKYW